MFNGNSGNKFEITDAEDISGIVNGIREISFRKKGMIADVDYWYYLTFQDESGKEVISLGIQNASYMRKDITKSLEFFYTCDGNLRHVGEYLESLEAVRFPDYKKNPEFDGY